MHNDDGLLLAFGDSLVAGHGLPMRDGFAAQLERRIGLRVVNGGVSGDTTAGALRRLPRLLSSLSKQPDLAIVQVGPNDVIHGVPPAETRRRLDLILLEFGRCRVPVVLTTVLPPPFLRARAAAYLDIPEELARRHGARLAPFFPDGIMGRADMVLADGVHPNGRAIAAVVEALLPGVEQALGRRPLAAA